MLHICRQNTEEEVQEYKIGQQTVRFTCDHCGHRKMIRICEIEDGAAICSVCRRRKAKVQE